MIALAGPSGTREGGPRRKGHADAIMNLPVPAPRGSSFDEPVLVEDFETRGSGSLPPEWQLHDADSGYSSWFERLSRWQTFRFADFPAHSGSRMMVCFYNDDAVPNDDWLILPEHTLTGTISLSYWVASQDAAYPESYEVRVSTTGTQPQDFTTLIFSDSAAPAVWTQRTHDLSAFAGVPFRIAFHYTSVNRFLLKLDDILLDGTVGPSGTIVGLVTDSEQRPLPDVLVRVLGRGDSVWTDATGFYVLDRLPAGTYTLHVRHEFYQSRLFTGMTVAVNETTRVDAVLMPHALIFRDYVCLSNPRRIADFDTARMLMNPNLTDTMIIYDLDVTVTLEHTYIGDLDIWLQSPDTVRVQLMAHDRFNDGQNITNCRFDDEAAQVVLAGQAPYTGRWRPQERLSRFNSDSTIAIRRGVVSGRWWVIVYDNYPQDQGWIRGYTLHVAALRPVPAADVPLLAPRAFDFESVYPNPFNRETCFRFRLAREGLVTLVLYDVLGREAARVVERVMGAGVHEVHLVADPLPSGVYFARLSAHGQSAVRKAVLLK